MPFLQERFCTQPCFERRNSKIKQTPFKAQRITHQLKTTKQNSARVPQRITYKGDLEPRQTLSKR